MSRKKLALIATRGTLDWAYPSFILASTAAALDYVVQIFIHLLRIVTSSSQRSVSHT
jgi:peroxiredoxin family protein